MTLGLVCALSEAEQLMSRYKWKVLRTSREAACRVGLDGQVGRAKLTDIAEHMLDVAQLGLHRRGFGEERFLAPLQGRLRRGKCPADDAELLVENGHVGLLLTARQW